MRRKVLFFSLVLIVLSVGLCSAQVLEPRLEQLLSKESDQSLLPITFYLRNDDLPEGNDFAHRLQTNSVAAQRDLRIFLSNGEQLGHVKHIRSLWIVNAISAEVSAAMVRQAVSIASGLGVEHVRLADTRAELARPEVPKQLQVTGSLSCIADTCWGLKRMKVFDVWQKGFKGQGIVVAILDEGVDTSHPFISDHLWANAGEIAGDGIDNDENWYIDDLHGFNFLDQNGNVNYKDPSEFHGTFVASKICGNVTTTPITGVAPEAQIMVCKIRDDSTAASESRFFEAIQYAVSNGARIINISQADKSTFEEDSLLTRYYWRVACNNARKAGVLIVAGVGNFMFRSGSEWSVPYNIAVPAAVPPPSQTENGGGVIGVGATDILDQFWADPIHSLGTSVGPTTWQNIAPWHDYGYPSEALLKPDLSAPGDSVWGAAVGGYCGYASGTSYSSPMVAGVAALMLSANPSLTPAEIDLGLRASTEDLGSPGWDPYFGYGLVDAQAAVTSAAPTVLSGTHSSSMSLARGVYVVSGAVVFSNTSLTIVPGVVLKFQPGASIKMSNSVLHAVGAVRDSIVFTSLKDDSYGGDTNGDGGLTQPAKGDWDRIWLAGSGGNQSILKYCVVRYGGSSGTGNIQCEQSGNGLGPAIENCSIGYSSNYGIYLGDVTYDAEGSSPDLVESIFHDNSSGAVAFKSNSFPVLTGDVFIRNGIEGVVYVGGEIYDSGTWHRCVYPYVLSSSTVQLRTGATLTIEPGVIVKIQTSCVFKMNGSTLHAVGAVGDSIVFTSIKDDSYGGDTNGDGGLTQPAKGAWDRIWLAGSGSNQSILKYCVVRYGGSAGLGDIQDDNTGSLGASIENSCIGYSSNYGVFCGGTSGGQGASPDISENVIHDNSTAPVALHSSSFPTFSGNVFMSDLPPIPIPLILLVPQEPEQGEELRSAPASSAMSTPPGPAIYTRVCYAA